MCPSFRGIVLTIPDLNLNFLGDGICDDSLNVELTNFDNGDCCDASASRDLCKICLCSSEYLEPKGNILEN